jgi:hypothetical protein
MAPVIARKQQRLLTRRLRELSANTYIRALYDISSAHWGRGLWRRRRCSPQAAADLWLVTSTRPAAARRGPCLLFLRKAREAYTCTRESPPAAHVVGTKRRGFGDSCVTPLFPRSDYQRSPPPPGNWQTACSRSCACANILAPLTRTRIQLCQAHCLSLCCQRPAAPTALAHRARHLGGRRLTGQRATFHAISS